MRIWYHALTLNLEQTQAFFRKTSGTVTFLLRFVSCRWPYKRKRDGLGRAGACTLAALRALGDEIAVRIQLLGTRIHACPTICAVFAQAKLGVHRWTEEPVA